MRLHVSVIGQSNEMGSGERRDQNFGLGNPIYPVNRGWWARFSRLMGNSGVWATIANRAVGTTSMAVWVGMCKQWVSGLLSIRGLYVLSSGGIWKCNCALSTVPTSTTQPTGTSDTTGADGIQWLYLGVPTGIDTDGVVYSQTDVNRFDPNGMLLQVKNDLIASRANKKILAFSIGQSDKTLSTTQIQFSTSIINMTEYLKPYLDKAFIGFTCYGATTGLDAYYSSTLIPAWNDVIAHYVGDPLVTDGPNLRTLLGILPVTPTVQLIGIKSDQLHLNDVALYQASTYWANSVKRFYP